MGAGHLQLRGAAGHHVLLQGVARGFVATDSRRPAATQVLRGRHGPPAVERSVRKFPPLSGSHPRAVPRHEHRVQLPRHGRQSTHRVAAKHRARHRGRHDQPAGLSKTERAHRAALVKARSKNRIAVPKPSPRRFFGHGIPNVELDKLSGKLIAVEGADGSGRSTQIARLVEWLEGRGHATAQVGLKRSTLVSEELDQAKRGNILSRTTLSLFYATDFSDQLENVILPALRAGFIVLADRYIYTLMARDLVRGMDMRWLKNLYGMALVPDAVFYLRV